MWIVAKKTLKSTQTKVVVDKIKYLYIGKLPYITQNLLKRELRNLSNMLQARWTVAGRRGGDRARLKVVSVGRLDFGRTRYPDDAQDASSLFFS
jgi:hypothetical protein